MAIQPFASPRAEGIKHTKRNKGGHEFLPWDYRRGWGEGRQLADDPMGVSQFCKCGLRLYDWRCKWLWS